MFKHKHTHRKPDPLVLLVILVSLAVMMTTAVARTNTHTMSLSDILDGDVMVAPVGSHGAGLHLSYQSHPYRHEAISKNSVRSQKNAISPTVFLSVRVPW
jgi:hypothetical protein